MVDILLPGFYDLQPLDPSMPAEIPINESTDQRARRHGSESDGQVAEPDLDRVVMVGFRELGGQAGENDVETGVDDAAVEKDDKALFFEQDGDGGEEARSSLFLDRIQCEWKAVLGPRSATKMGY